MDHKHIADGDIYIYIYIQQTSSGQCCVDPGIELKTGLTMRSFMLGYYIASKMRVSLSRADPSTVFVC